MAGKQAAGKAKSRRVFGQARKPAKMFRAGLYARISTHDQQTLLMQNSAVREYAARRGWAIAMKFREVGSGWAARSPCEGTGGSTPPEDRRGARIIVFVPGAMGLAGAAQEHGRVLHVPCQRVGSRAVRGFS